MGRFSVIAFGAGCMLAGGALFAPAQGQIVPTYQHRDASVDFYLQDDDEDYQFGDYLSDWSTAPFSAALEFNESISGASAWAQSSQHSSISGSRIRATGEAGFDANVVEPGASVDGCVASSFYLEFTLAEPTPFHLVSQVDGEVYGELRTTDYAFYLDLSYSHSPLSDVLPAGDYVLNIAANFCSQLDEEGADWRAGTYDLTMLLDACTDSLELGDFTGDSPVILSGDAIITEEGVLRVTPDAVGRFGAAWSPSKLHVGNGFDTTFLFRVSEGASGGDGFAFVLQDEGPLVLGGGGSDLGYAGISRSLAIEFDTFSFSGEFAADHISVQTSGTGPNSAHDSASLGHAVLAASLKDGQVHSCRVLYTAGQLDIFLDGGTSPVLSVAVDLENISGESILDDNGCTRAGFTAATGAATSAHDILSWGFGLTCAQRLHYPDFTNSPNLAMVGSAAIESGDTLRLTPEAGDHVGAAWHHEKVSVADGFITQFAFRVSPGSEPPADGFAFVIQSQGLDAIGGGGHALGYGNNDVPGISRSLAVEFDTFSGMDVSVQTRGSNPNDSDDAYSLGQAFPASIADGEIHTCRIVYAPGSLDIYLDGSSNPLLSVPVDLRDLDGDTVVGASGCAWVGFTAATGGFFSSHDILNWSLGPNCSAAPPPGDFDGDCDVDEQDLAEFLLCSSGPALPISGDCESKDLDQDDDVDADDFGILQRCYSGAGANADPLCAE